MNKILPRIAKLEKRLPLEKFIPAAFMLFLLIVIVLSMISFRNIEDYKKDVEWVTHSHDILRLNSDINSKFFQLTTYRKIFFTTGDTSYRTDYYETRKKLTGEINSLNDLTIDNPILHNNVFTLDTLINMKLALLDSTLEMFFKEKRIPENESLITEKIRIDLLDISGYANRIEVEEAKLLSNRNEKAQISNSNIRIYIIITSLTAFLFIGLSLFISGRLIRKKNTAERLLQDSYDELEDRVKERTSELQKAEEELKNSYDELEKRVNERTIDLATTLNKLLDEIAAKEKVQNRLKLFGHALRGIKECVYITDLRGKTIFVNPAFEAVYKLRESEILGENIPVLFSKNISEEKRNEIMSSALKTGWKGELVNTDSSGSDFFINLSASVIRDDNGRADFIVGIVQDITYDKNLSALLEKRNRLLSLLNDVIIGTSKIENMNKCISSAVKKVCDYLHWDVGQFYLNTEGKLINQQYLFESTEHRYDVFRSLTKEISLEDDESLHKEFIKVTKPAWVNIPRLKSDRSDKITEQCFISGLSFCVWVPVICRGNLSAALEFFYAGNSEPDSEVIDCLSNISVELGTFIEKNEFLVLLKEREKHFKAIAESANDAIVTANNENKIVYINSSVTEIFGYQVDELLDQDLALLIPESNDSEQFASFLMDVKRRDDKIHNRSIELSGRRKDGADFPVEVSISHWNMNEKSYFTFIIRDISFRKQIHDELIESRNSLLEAQSIARMGNWEWDLRSNSVRWSAEMYSIYELEKNEFDATYEGFLSRLHPESLQMVMSQYENSLKTKMPFEFYERIVTPSGKIKILRSQGGVKLDECGSVFAMIGTCLDVTEIKEAEDKIRENEERLRLILDNVKDYAIIMLDEKGFIKSWNKGAEQIKGYKADEIIGKHISVFYRKEDVDANEAERNLETAAKFGRYEKEGWRVKKDGSLYLADIIFTPVFDSTKNITGFVKVTRDITEKKQAEEALRSSERKLLEAQKIAKIGNWDWDIRSNIVTWSDEMYNIYGVNNNSFDKSIDGYKALIHPDDVELVRNTMQNSIRNGKPFNYFHRIITPSGEVKILNAIGEVYMNENGEVERLFGISMDVTDIKTAEEKIKKSERQLKEAQEITKLGSWEADLRTGKLYWSDEMFRIYGTEPREYGMDFHEWRKYVLPEDVDSIDEFVSSMIERPHQKEIRFRIATPEGRLKYLEAETRVEYDEFLVPVRLFGSVQDITDIKLVEDELRRTNSILSETQKELVHKEKLAALGRFASGIAHEIRNPLANISALSQLLSKLDLDERSKKHLKYILVNADIANKIIKDLLNFAAPDDPIIEKEDLGEMISNILESAAPRCAESKIKINKELPQGKMEMFIDKTRMENAIMNFISNSIEAMPEGGIIGVSAKIDHILKKTIIKISDTGEGIPQENIDKIFEPFFTTKKSGTGLGLALSFQTIKSHGGELYVQSKQGAGTTIEVILPINKET